MNPIRPRAAGSPFAAMTRLVEQCGGADAAADFSGRSKFTVYKWTDPDQSDGAPFAVVAQLTEHFGATAAAEHLAMRAGGIFMPLPAEGGAQAQWGRLTAASAQHFATVMGGIARALSPDSEDQTRVTPKEARGMIADLDHAIRDLAALRGLALETAGEGGG